MNHESSDSNAGLRVLIVDDEEDFSAALAKRLQRRRLEVSVADGANNALEFLKRAVFQVIVLDLSMPGLDGISLLTRIKALDPKVEVIILTGRTDLKYVERAMALGAYDYILKPPDFDELLYKIQDAAPAKSTTSLKAPDKVH